MSFAELKNSSNLARALSISLRSTVNETRIFPGLAEWNTEPGAYNGGKQSVSNKQYADGR
jgi:hypothetical protein